MEIEILKQLAVMGACREQIHLSTSTLASTLGMSTETAERGLSSLEDQGYIVRTTESIGQKVRITEDGWLQLPPEYQQYRSVLKGPHQRIIHGKVAAGMGKGRYYISLDGYKEQLKANLGFEPYPGTLNIKLEEPFDPPKQQAIKIAGFRDEGRTFGGCSCYKIKIDGMEGAIVLPDKSNHPADLVEVIAPVGLRESLHLTEGDEVELTLL